MVIYEVIETNVNGCGEDAAEYVAFGKSEPLTNEEQAIFQAALNNARIEGNQNDWDTSTRVEAATEAFFEKTGITCWTTGNPAAGRFEF